MPCRCKSQIKFCINRHRTILIWRVHRSNVNAAHQSTSKFSAKARHGLFVVIKVAGPMKPCVFQWWHQIWRKNYRPAVVAMYPCCRHAFKMTLTGRIHQLGKKKQIMRLEEATFIWLRTMSDNNHAFCVYGIILLEGTVKHLSVAIQSPYSADEIRITY